ncbi:MAG: type II toxin-antitoxin system PemK/MazF family toxin [Deltaproteobacteria bacterium]|nr:type II toxin-antitoxin system PemK/MazF family toxin [Deltaproteobacteria bacterium]
MIRRGHVHLARMPGEVKRRPVVVLSSDRRNDLAYDVTVVPCSTNLRLGPWHVMLERGAGGLPARSVAKCEQVTTVRKDGLELRPLGGALSAELMARIRIGALRALEFDE